MKTSARIPFESVLWTSSVLSKDKGSSHRDDVIVVNAFSATLDVVDFGIDINFIFEMMGFPGKHQYHTCVVGRYSW